MHAYGAATTQSRSYSPSSSHVTASPSPPPSDTVTDEIGVGSVVLLLVPPLLKHATARRPQRVTDEPLLPLDGAAPEAQGRKAASVPSDQL